MRRRLTDLMMTAGSLLALIAALVVIDPRVREQIMLRLSAQPVGQLEATGREMRNLTSVIYVAAHEQSIAHAPLVLFGLAAIVLTIFMLRT